MDPESGSEQGLCQCDLGPLGVTVWNQKGCPEGRLRKWVLAGWDLEIFVDD